jgi:hypothetical protein
LAKESTGETVLYFPYAGEILSAADPGPVVTVPGGRVRGAMLEKAPAKTDADAPSVLGRFFGDYELITSTVLTARAMARVGNVHFYQFSRWDR